MDDGREIEREEGRGQVMRVRWVTGAVPIVRALSWICAGFENDYLELFYISILSAKKGCLKKDSRRSEYKSLSRP